MEEYSRFNKEEQQMRRQDDRLWEQMLARIYPDIEQRFCDNFNCSKAELYELVTSQLARQRNKKRNMRTIIAAGITASITTGIAFFTDWFRR